MTNDFQVDNRIRENFNSVDLTEIEFYDDNEIKPRRPHENILKVVKQVLKFIKILFLVL